MRYTAVLLCLLAWRTAAAGRQWIDVPYVKQAENGCGPASLAMVVEYWRGQGFLQDHPAGGTPEAAFPDSAKHGVRASGMAAYLGERGFTVHAFEGTLAVLRHHVALGRPLIVALGDGEGKPLHYVVVVGTGDGEVLINDPAAGRLKPVPADQFDRRWEQTGRWTLLAVPAVRP